MNDTDDQEGQCAEEKRLRVALNASEACREALRLAADRVLTALTPGVMAGSLIALIALSTEQSVEVRSALSALERMVNGDQAG